MSSHRLPTSSVPTLASGAGERTSRSARASGRVAARVRTAWGRR